jgi:hypothetical protein
VLPAIAPFFDDNLGIRKSDYYNNIIKHLKCLTYHQNSNSNSNTKQFDPSLINGALSMDLYQEKQEPAASILSEFNDSNLRDQIILLRKVPKLPSNISIDSSDSNNQQILIFSSLMSTCYKSLHKVEISSYNSELFRSMSLRFLYEFDLAYSYMKNWVAKFTTRSKGMKSTTQVNALLTGRISL